jgi:beta-lactam-binding protein with PASTA domain
MSRKRQVNLQTKFIGWGKVCLLGGIIVSAFLMSMIIGMRLAVRGHEVETPALVGMALSDAQVVFQRLHLKLMVSGNRYDEMVPAGAIISQVPGAGVRTKSDGNVQVIVSLGRRTRPIPELSGSSVRAARLLLEQEQYQLGRISELPMPEGRDLVVAQWPRPPAGAGTTDRVDVLVESIGSNLNRALLELEGLGFEARTYYRDYPGARRGIVVRQFPEPGYPIARDQVVNLEVAR